MTAESFLAAAVMESHRQPDGRDKAYCVLVNAIVPSQIMEAHNSDDSIIHLKHLFMALYLLECWVIARDLFSLNVTQCK